MNPSTLRAMFENFRVIKVWKTLDGPAVDIVINDNVIGEHPTMVEQQNGNVQVFGGGWSLLCGATNEISNRAAYDILNAPGYYVRLPHPDVKRNTFVIAYHPPVFVNA